VNYQSTLRKTNPNKTKKADDNATAAAPLAETKRMLELSTLQLHMVRETYSKT